MFALRFALRFALMFALRFALMLQRADEPIDATARNIG